MPRLTAAQLLQRDKAERQQKVAKAEAQRAVALETARVVRQASKEAAAAAACTRPTLDPSDASSDAVATSIATSPSRI
jgi:hypothetical protein